MARDGSIDWLCWPRFDSPALFAALLDRERGGCCRIAPVDPPSHVEREYLSGTAIIATTFHTASGAVRVTDFMPVADADVCHRTLRPDRELIRIVEGISGRVDVAIEYRPRPDFTTVPRLRDRGTLGVYCEQRGRVTAMRCSLPVDVDVAAARVTGRVTVVAGERHCMVLTFADRAELVLPLLGKVADEKLVHTRDWWRAWSSGNTYRGPWREMVARSAITLKLLCFAPSGAVVAAPTTSLPEHLGGTRNWDYRYCWIRDASLTLQSLFDLGYAAEAEAFVSWMLYTTRITRPQLRVLYDVYGNHRLRERTVPGLQGYAGSQPVRLGNGAHRQLQLDVYGEALDAVHAFEARGGRLCRSSRAMLKDWAGVAATRWNDADNGIWEDRSECRQHTYSMAMCWVALERFCQLADTQQLSDHKLAEHRQVQQEIRDCIARRGFNRELGAYTRRLDGTDVDASLLLLARHGYVDASCDEMAGTYRVIEQRLAQNGLLYRYRTDDGLPPGEGTFGICSFWAVTYLALAGRLDEAEARFNHVLSFANDVGLLSEEIDADTGAALGNFPQAFTHVGLIDAALTIEHCRGRQLRATHPATGATT